MKVKISVKKLHKMEMASKLRLDAAYHALQKEEESNNEYRDKVASYRDKVAELSLDRECLNNKLAEADASLQRMHDRIEAYQKEVEDLKKDRKDWEDAARSAADNL